MKLIGGVVTIGVGGLAVLLGLLFLIGSAGELHRIAVGAVGLGVGGALIALGARLQRRAAAAMPDQVEADVLAIAAARSGEVSAAELDLALGWRAPLAAAVLERLIGADRCEQKRVAGALYYVFGELQPRLVVRRCGYCKVEVPMDEEATTCPQCGGAVERGVERVALAESADLYGMDANMDMDMDMD